VGCVAGHGGVGLEEPIGLGAGGSAVVLLDGHDDGEGVRAEEIGMKLQHPLEDLLLAGNVALEVVGEELIERRHDAIRASAVRDGMFLEPARVAHFVDVRHQVTSG
jgi:hypothetical protein